MVSKPTYLFLALSLCLLFSNCVSAQNVTIQNKDASQTVIPLPKNLKRPVPNTISYEIPNSYKQAIKNGTRTRQGKPGPNYWRQYSQYTLNVKIIPDEKKLIGSGTIAYHNNSPDTLRMLYLELALNYKRGGLEDVEKIDYFSVNGNKLTENKGGGRMAFFMRQKPKPGYSIRGTNMIVILQNPILPGETAHIKMKWHYKIPVMAAGGRMGYYNHDGYFYMAYWYPQIRVYDDVNGWYTTTFKPRTEFYHEFADYQLNISVPDQWIVNSTGTLQNAKELLQDDVYNRLQKAYSGTDIVQVVGPDDFGNITKTSNDGYLTWTYKAHQVNDVAFSATKNTIWDATTTSVGDRNNDGKTDYSKINAIYSPKDTMWTKAAKYEQDAIHFLSTFSGLSYPWPHMTAVASIGRGSGMEYPMMTLIGTFAGSSNYNFYRVIAHELGHMWDPMQLASNERRYAWMDEGNANFLASQALRQFLRKSGAKSDRKPEFSNFNAYLRLAGSDREDPIMRWSQYYYQGGYTVASYWKPASALISLRSVLGKATFKKAYQTYLQEWQFKHPYPWDMFKTFENVSGRNLDWFWRSWYYTTWILDQAVGKVQKTTNGTKITIKDLGNIPMPTTISITLDNGKTLTKHISIDSWLHGTVKTTLIVHSSANATKVVVNPKHPFPDADRANNVWKKM